MKLAAFFAEISGPAWWPTMSLRQFRIHRFFLAPKKRLETPRKIDPCLVRSWWQPELRRFLNHLGCTIKPCKSWDFNYLFPQLVRNPPDFWLPSTVSSNKKTKVRKLVVNSCHPIRSRENIEEAGLVMGQTLIDKMVAWRPSRNLATMY